MKPDKEKSRRVVNIEREIHHSLKVYCVVHGLKVEWIVNKIIADYLANVEKGN